MRSLDPRTALRVGMYLLAGLLITLGIRALRAPGPAENPAYDSLVVALGRRITADSVALDSATQRLAAAQAKVRPALVRYKELRDTLVITDTIAVREFVQRSDSVARSCTELAESCERFRVRADSSLASLRLDRDRWKLTAESLKPSGLSLFVRRTLPVVAFGVGLWAGSRVVR